MLDYLHDCIRDLVRKYAALLSFIVVWGSAPVLLQHLTRVGPSWPDYSATVSLFTSIVAWLVLFYSWVTYRKMGERKKRTLLGRSAFTVLVLLLVYILLMATVVYPMPDYQHALVGGFLVQPSVAQIIKQNPGMDVRQALEGAGGNPFLVWVPWTVIISRLVLLFSWLGFFAALSQLIAIFLFLHEEPQKTKTAGGATQSLNTTQNIVKTNLYDKRMEAKFKEESTVIKILFLAANPKDTGKLRLDEEIRGIDQALREAEFRDKFKIEQHWAVRVADLQGYFLRHRPDIVHFSGHGSVSSEIILEDNNGSSQPVSSHALSQLFSVLKDNIRCVVLNACYSEQQAQAIANHINCVVGMSNAIGDNAAISFATAFYQALGYGRDVKTAFDLGCGRIDLEGLEEHNKPKLSAINVNPQDIVFV